MAPAFTGDKPRGPALSAHARDTQLESVYFLAEQRVLVAHRDDAVSGHNARRGQGDQGSRGLRISISHVRLQGVPQVSRLAESLCALDPRLEHLILSLSHTVGSRSMFCASTAVEGEVDSPSGHRSLYLARCCGVFPAALEAHSACGFNSPCSADARCQAALRVGLDA